MCLFIAPQLGPSATRKGNTQVLGPEVPHTVNGSSPKEASPMGTHTQAKQAPKQVCGLASVMGLPRIAKLSPDVSGRETRARVLWDDIYHLLCSSGTGRKTLVVSLCDRPVNEHARRCHAVHVRHGGPVSHVQSLFIAWGRFNGPSPATDTRASIAPLWSFMIQHDPEH